MKMHFFKIGTAAMLMTALSGVAHAANSATVEFEGVIAKGTCDVTVSNGGTAHLSLGNFSLDQLPATAATAVPGAAASTALAFSNCSAAQSQVDADGKKTFEKPAVTLMAEGAGQNSAVSGLDAWGDDSAWDTGIGVTLTGTQQGGSATEITPKSNTMDLKTTTPDTTTGIYTVKPVTINAGLKTLREKSALKAGPFKATVVFSAFYN